MHANNVANLNIIVMIIALHYVTTATYVQRYVHAYVGNVIFFFIFFSCHSWILCNSAFIWDDMVVGHHHVTACSFSKGVIVSILSILSLDIGLYRTAFQSSSVSTQWFCFANWVGAPRMNDATRMRFNAAATISGTALSRDYIQSRAFIRIECERGEKESGRGCLIW